MVVVGIVTLSRGKGGVGREGRMGEAGGFGGWVEVVDGYLRPGVKVGPRLIRDL